MEQKVEDERVNQQKQKKGEDATIYENLILLTLIGAVQLLLCCVIQACSKKKKSRPTMNLNQ